MPPETPTSQDLARRLVEREPNGEATADPAATAHAACEYLYGELSRWVGPTGCQTLFARALRNTHREHPALASVQVRRDVRPHLEGIAEATQTAGSGATAAALQAVLVELIELLGRFIGDDMVASLVERSNPVLTEDGVSPEARRRRHGRG